MDSRRREFIGASLAVLGAGSAFSQQTQPGATNRAAPPVPSRKGKITKLFKSPEGYPNALSVAPEGWWIKTAPETADGARDCFALTIGDKPKDATFPVALRITLTGVAGAIETTIQAAPKA